MYTVYTPGHFHFVDKKSLFYQHSRHLFTAYPPLIHILGITCGKAVEYDLDKLPDCSHSFTKSLIFRRFSTWITEFHLFTLRVLLKNVDKSCRIELRLGYFAVLAAFTFRRHSMIEKLRKNGMKFSSILKKNTN